MFCLAQSLAMQINDSVREKLGPYLGIGVHAAGLALGFASNFLLARLLGPEGYGIYGFAYSLVVFLGIPLHAGLATLLIKDVTRYRVAGDPARLRGILRAAIAITVALSFLSALLLFVFSYGQREKNFSEFSPVIAVAALLLPLMAIAAIRGGILRGLGRPLAGLLPDAIVRPGLLAVIMALAFVLPGLSISSTSAMLWHAAAAFVAMVVGILMVRHYLPADVAASKPVYEWRSWISALIPLSLLGGLQALSSVVAMTALGNFHPAQELGFYRIAELGGSLVSMPLSAVAAYSAGKVAQLLASNSHVQLQHEVTSMGRIALTGAIPIGLLLIAGGGWLIEVGLGASFGPSALPMAILCAGQLMNAMSGIGGVLATMSGHYREANKAFGLALLVQVVGALLLVPEYGAVGAAIASAMSTIVWSQLLRHRMSKLLKIDSFALGRHAFALKR